MALTRSQKLSLSAKRQKRSSDRRRFVTQYPMKKEAGIIVITCLKNRRQYVTRTTDIRQLTSALWSRLEHHQINDAIDEDYRLYGKQWFRIGVAEILEGRINEDDEAFKERLEALYNKYLSKRPYYNIYNNSFTIIKRSNIAELGQGKQKRDTTYHRPLRQFSAIYVLTCMKNGKQWLGYSRQGMKRCWENMYFKLKHGKCFAKVLQEDWSKYGTSSFVMEFCEIDPENIKASRREVKNRLKPIYNTQRFSWQRDGNTAGQ